MLILIVGFGLRLFGLNWDQATYLHPDERHVVADVLVGRITLDWPVNLTSLIDPDSSSINPRPLNVETGTQEGFAYGTFPLYMTDLAAEALTRVTGVNWHAYGRVHYIGRIFSVLLDTGTILLTFLLARRIANEFTGLIAAAFYAVAPMAIQLAHFFTAESWITFFVTLSLLGAAHGARTGSLGNFLVAGAAAGLAVASKASVAGIVIPIAVAVLLDGVHRFGRGDDAVVATSSLLARGTLACAAFLTCFALGEPFAFLDAAAYLNSFRLQVDIQAGTLDVPFTRQYVGTIRGWYQLEQMIRWGLGPVLGVLALVGVPALIATLLRKPEKRRALIVVLTWLVVYGAAVLVAESKFLRYMLPLVPVLAIGAGLCVAWIIPRLRSALPHRLVHACLLVGAALAVSWTAAFAAIYTHPHPRLAASEWFFEHAAPGSATNTEVWDDRVPLSTMPGLDGFTRRIADVQINLYQDFPSLGDAAHLSTAFAASDVSAQLSPIVAQHDFATASQMLHDSLARDLLDMDSAARVRLSGELSKSAARMTTSRELRTATTIAAQSLLLPDERAEVAWSIFADELGLVPSRTAESYLYDALSRTDYYVLSSNRVMSGISGSPWRYPVQGRFYELLLEERIGFRLEREFTSFPRLGGVEIPDDAADESFINYDHPHVWIFKKERLPDRQSFAQLIAPASIKQTQPDREPPDEPALVFDRPVGELPVVDDARWSAGLTSQSWWALAVWTLLLIALQLAGAPLAAVIFSGFPDGGWAAARLLTLLLAGWIVWFLASVQAIAFRALWCGVAFVTVALAGWLIRRWFEEHSSATSRRSRGRSFLIAEAVFWTTFAIFLFFRYLNPDSWHPLWGGEKPMEFAHLNAILRSAHFPPVDPWYADGFLNYYYYGTYLVAFMIKLTGIPSEIAFNLAQPTIIALFAAMTFSVAAAFGSRLSGRPRLGIIAGLVGVVVVSFSGNGLAATRVVESAFGEQGFVSRWDYWVWDARQVIPFTINEFPYFTALYADLHAHVVAWPITVLVIGLAYGVARDRRAFALAWTAPRRFSGHAVLLLVRLTILALVIGSLAPTNAWDVATYAALIVVALIAAFAIVRSILNRVAVATACVSFIAAVAGLAYAPFHANYVVLFRSIRSVRPEDTTPLHALLLHFGGPIAVLIFGLMLINTQQNPRHGRRWLSGPRVLMVLIAVFTFVHYSATRAPEYIELSNALAITAVGFILIASIADLLRHRSLTPATILALVVLATSIVAIVYTGQTGRPTMAMYLALGSSAACGWLLWEKPTERFIAALITGGMLLGAALEVVFLVDNLADTPFFRMNTVFKFYNQLWVLFGVAIGALVALAVDRAMPTIATSAETRDSATDTRATSETQPLATQPRRSRHSTVGHYAGWTVAVAVVAVVISLAYPLTATMPRLETRFAPGLGSRTLNALDWMNYGTVPLTDGGELAFSEDRGVIDWFNRSVAGTPVLAEAAFGPYRCNGSRISIATGLPAVVGWVNHQTQQRDAGDLWEREGDLQTLYTDPDTQTKREIIDKYAIDYIVVGQLERNFPRINNRGNCVPDGEIEGINAFDEMVGTTLEVAFRSGSTLVYRVI